MNNMDTGKKKQSSILVIVIVFVALAAMLFLNAALIYGMTARQIETIGQDQIDGITRSLESMLERSEYMTAILTEQSQERMDNGASIEEMRAFFIEQSILQNKLTGDIFMNVFISNKDYTIMPGYSFPDDFNVEERIWYNETLKKKTGETYISPAYTDYVSGNMCYTVSSPLADRKNIVGIDFNLSRIQSYIEELRNGNKNEALIVSRDGTVIGYGDAAYLGKNISEVLPAYQPLLEDVVSKKQSGPSFDYRLDGKKTKIFCNSTKNGWFLIVSINEWEFYKDSYLQLFRNSALNILLIVLVVFLYIQARNNQNRAEKALRARDEFLSGLSKELKNPLNRILNVSNSRENDIRGEDTGVIRESAQQLSATLDNLFSYSDLVRTNISDSGKTSGKRSEIKTQIGSRTRWQVTTVLAAAMILVLVFCCYTLTELGNSRITKESGDYYSQLGEWMDERKTILDMYTYAVASEPEILNDRASAEAFLQNIASNYPEISLVYIGNPNMPWKVIMNSGWIPDDDYVLQAYPWYADTMTAGGDFLISGPYYDTQQKKYSLTFSKKMYGADGAFLGVFAIDFDLAKLTELMESTYSKDGYAFLISDNGVIINHPDAAYQLSNTNSVNVQKLEYKDVYKQDGKIDSIRDYDGVLRTLIARHDAASGFTIIVAKDWNTVRGRIILYSALVVVLFGFCIFAVTFLIRKMLAWQQEVNIRLKEAADAANQATRAKSHFLAQMSHEIRTPINAVLGMNEMILRENENKDIDEYARNIQSAGRTLLSLINSILDFSKIEDGKMEIIPTEYSTADLMGEISSMISDRAVKKNLEWDMNIDNDLPCTLYGDSVRIKQIIVNLLTNAVKYTHEGRISFIVKGINAEDAPDSIYLHIEVIDTGIGIREEDITKLFESFRRLDEEKNHNVEGTGLGISIVQSLLKMMDSTLKVESEYGKGSKFYFDLKQKVADRMPIGKRTEQAEVAERKTEKFRVSDARVLVVDDNDMNLKVFTSLLKGSGLDIDTAQSGQDCLLKAGKHRYDIIFMDHMMPGMDGIETFSEMKLQKDGLNGSTPVIMLTANAIIGMKETYLEAGFSGYLSKPIDKDELIETLRKFLPDEKIIRSDSSDDPEKEEITEMERFKELIEAFPDIDINKGLAYCSNSEDFYIELLKDFAAPAKREELQKAYDDNDLKLYAVKIHAIKGNARTLGLVRLGEISEGLQFAAEKEEAEYIAAHHAEAAEELEKLEKCVEQL